MTYSHIAVDFVVVPGLLPRGGRVLPIPGTAQTIEATPTDQGLEFLVEGRVVLVPWSRVQATVAIPPLATAPRVAQPPPVAKRRNA